jgi:hypothetical protein
VALLATGDHGRRALGRDERVRGTPGSAGLILLTELHLGWAQSLFSIDRCPTGSSVTAVKEFLVNGFVATAAITSGEVAAADFKSVMVIFLLTRSRLVTIKAVDAFPGVDAHFVFVDNGVLQPGVAFGALAAGTNEIRGRLFCFNLGSRSIDEKGREDKRKSNSNSDENGTKRHHAHL